MAQVIAIERTGGPEELRPKEVVVGAPGAGEVRIRHRAVGVNFIDVYHRSGLYKVPSLPFTPGVEGAGVVEAVGAEVTDFRVGDRVAYAGPTGGYAEARLLPAAKLVALPASISDEQAAAVMLKGLTAQMLLERVLPIGRGDKVLLHAAAGGVGLLMCQWARHLGIDVIGTAGGPEKCARVLAAGATHAIDYRAQDFVPRVRELTSGAGVRAVFDSVGADTFMRSFDCLRPFGMMVSFGQSSGAVPPFDVLTLQAKGSLYLTRPSVMSYIADRTQYLRMTRSLFEVISEGAVRVEIGARFPLAEAADAHRALESRGTVGSSILTV